MKNLLRALFIIVLLSLNACLTTTQPLPDAKDPSVSKVLQGRWELGQGDFVSDVSPQHTYIHIYTSENGATQIITSKNMIKDKAQGYKACREDLALCYDAYVTKETMVNGWKIMGLRDHFRAKDEDFSLIIAYDLALEGQMHVYNIRDESIRKAVADGQLVKMDESAEINSDPLQVIAWLKTLKEEDLKLYARYKKQAV